MKTAAFLIAILSVASAFAPQSAGRSNTALSESLFDKVFGMDLFDYKGNEYGARSKKNMKTGKIGSNSYVPNGLNAEQYNKIRKAEADKKEKNYQRNVKKAGKFLGYDEFYKKRGTNEDFSWKSTTNGHRFAKTKYDFSGKKQEAKIPEAFGSSIFGRKNKK